MKTETQGEHPVRMHSEIGGMRVQAKDPCRPGRRAEGRRHSVRHFQGSMALHLNFRFLASKAVRQGISVV